MRRKVWVAAQWLFAAAVIWYAADALAGRWDEVGARMRRLHPSWSYVVTASLLMWSTYALMIVTWRSVLATWSTKLGYVESARVWLAANLGKYLPGKVWSVMALGALARDRGASGVAAGGAALLLQLVSLATGAGVAAILSAQTVGSRSAAIAVAAVIVAVMLFLPRLLRPAFAGVRGLTGRDIAIPPMPQRVTWMAVAATAISWFIAGASFRFFAESIGMHNGSMLGYIGAYAASYVAGMIALFAPGGIGVREGALVATMERTGLASAPDAALLAVVSRIWMTLLDLIPGLIALASARRASKAARNVNAVTPR